MSQVPAAGPTGSPKKVWIIVGIVVAVMMCCLMVAVGLVVGGIVAFDSIEEQRIDDVEVQLDAIDEVLEDFEDDGFFPEEGFLEGPSDEDIWYEAERAVEHFHPAFHLSMMGLAEEYDGIQRYNLVAESDQTPGFLIAFMTPRQSAGGDVTSGEYVDPESSMRWTHESWASGGMASFAGATPMVNDGMRAGIETSFVSAHPDGVVTDFDLHSNIKIGLNGIHADELGSWYGDYTTFEAIYDNDLQAGVWREASFLDQR